MIDIVVPLRAPGIEYHASTPLIIIEYLEEKPTRWLIAEISEAYREAGRTGAGFLVTNAKDPLLQAILEREGIPFMIDSVRKLRCPEPIILLDMRANKTLEVSEASNAGCIVIGGIMGDYPPRARGLLLYSILPGAIDRNLGKGQMSIHSTAWVVARMLEGTSLDEISFVTPGIIEVENPFGPSIIELPFHYPDPKGTGKGFIPESVKKAILEATMWDERDMWS